jgi:translation initiation factor 4G
VFEKALAEPGFSPVYADFCVKVGSEKSLVDDEGQTQTFKRLILNQCQSEFEQEGTLAVDSALTDAERVVAIARQKQRMLGMIRFIGELFIRDMIKVGIMNICVQTLLGNVEDPVEESLEALCKLLITVGAAMEKKKQKELGMTFEELGKLSSSKKISSRLRFMVQDIIDLRRDGWKGRLTADINLKKLGKQGTDDAGDAKRQDARTKRAASDNMRAPAALMGGKRVDRFAAPNRTPTKEEVDDDGFSTAVGKKGKFGKQPVVAATEDTRPGAVSDIPIPSGRKGGSAHAGTSPAGTPNGKGNGGGKYMPSSNAQAKEEEEAKKKKKKPTAREMGGGSSFGLLLSSSDDEDKAESSDEVSHEQCTFVLAHFSHRPLLRLST